MTAKAAAKSSPISAQFRPDGSVVTTSNSRSALLRPSTSLLTSSPWSLPHSSRPPTQANAPDSESLDQVDGRGHIRDRAARHRRIRELLARGAPSSPSHVQSARTGLATPSSVAPIAARSFIGPSYEVAFHLRVRPQRVRPARESPCVSLGKDLLTRVCGNVPWGVCARDDGS